MSAGKKELLCSECCKRVSYQILKRPAKVLIKDLEIEYVEQYGICDECKEEIFVPGLDDLNEEKVEELYRKRKELITIPEIKSILEKYNIEKRPLSKLLGFGELTITRYIDGQLPSKRYSDVLYEILFNEQKMKEFTLLNKELVSSITSDKVLRAIEKCEEEKKCDNSAEKIALYIIKSGKEITNLLLQKILYYAKGISTLFAENSIIPEPCEAWKFGPVFPTVYNKYKDFGKQEITLNVSDDYVNNLLTENEKNITDYVMNTFGIYNALFLMNLSHVEDPWRCAREGIDDNKTCNNIIDDLLIKEYFKKMNKKYNLKDAEGVNLYINDMRKRIYKPKI